MEIHFVFSKITEGVLDYALIFEKKKKIHRIE